MRLYTTFTPSHKALYEGHFLRTLPRCFEPVVVEYGDQPCPSGRYKNEGWDLVCMRKADLFLGACMQNMGGVFFYCDVDVQFFGEGLDAVLMDELADADIACQDDLKEFNSGVFVCRCNDRTLAMFRSVRENYAMDDQSSLNRHIGMCRARRMSRRFFNVGMILKSTWNGQTEFGVPENIVLHHANWTIGVPNKMRLLEMVRNKYDENRVPLL